MHHLIRGEHKQRFATDYARQADRRSGIRNI
jgi:hypothetical protein